MQASRSLGSTNRGIRQPKLRDIKYRPTHELDVSTLMVTPTYGSKYLRYRYPEQPVLGKSSCNNRGSCQPGNLSRLNRRVRVSRKICVVQFFANWVLSVISERKIPGRISNCVAGFAKQVVLLSLQKRLADRCASGRFHRCFAKAKEYREH